MTLHCCTCTDSLQPAALLSLGSSESTCRRLPCSPSRCFFRKLYLQPFHPQHSLVLSAASNTSTTRPKGDFSIPPLQDFDRCVLLYICADSIVTDMFSFLSTLRRRDYKVSFAPLVSLRAFNIFVYIFNRFWILCNARQFRHLVNMCARLSRSSVSPTRQMFEWAFQFVLSDLSEYFCSCFWAIFDAAYVLSYSRPVCDVSERHRLLCAILRSTTKVWHIYIVLGVSDSFWHICRYSRVVHNALSGRACPMHPAGSWVCLARDTVPATGKFAVISNTFDSFLRRAY